MQRSDLRRRLTAAVLSHPRWRVGPAPKRLKLAKGTRVDRKMIEQADDKIRERVDYYLGRMFGGEDVPETMEDLSHVTSQVRETFERLYEDVEDIVEDEELTQAESTELWKVVSKALTDQVYDVIYGTQEVLDPDDYDKLEKAVIKGFDDSDEGPLVDEDDEEERQEALDEYLGNGGKNASDLRRRLVRLAHENPKLRPHLLPLLSRTAGTESALLEALLPKVRWYRLTGRLDPHTVARGNKVYEAFQERVRLTSNEDRALGIVRNLMAKRDVDSAYLVESARKAADLLGLPPNDTSMAKFDGPLAKLFQPSDWYGFVNKVDRDGARLLNASLAYLESRVEVLFRSDEFRNAFWKLMKFSEGSAPSVQEISDTIADAADAMGLSPGQRAASRHVSAAPKTENEKMMDWVNNKIKSYTRMTTTLPSEEDIESTRKKLVNYANMIIKKRQEKVDEYEAALQGFDPEAWSEDMRKYQRETFPTRPVKDPDVNFHIEQLKNSLYYFKQAVLNWEALRKMANTRQYGELVTALLKFRAALDLSNSGRNPS